MCAYIPVTDIGAAEVQRHLQRARSHKLIDPNTSLLTEQIRIDIVACTHYHLGGTSKSAAL